MKTTFTTLFLFFISTYTFAQSWTYVGGQGVVQASGTTTAFNEDLFFHNGELHMSYSFGTPGAPQAIHLKKWDGTAWQDVATYQAVRPIRNGDIEIAPNGTIYAAYSFTAGPAIQSAKVLQYDGTNWVQLGDSLVNFTGAVDLLIGADNTVYLGNQSAVYKWDGTAFQQISDAGAKLGIGDDFMYAAPNNDIYIAYGFSAAGAYYVTLAKYDGTTWSSASDTFTVALPNALNLRADASGNIYLGMKDVSPSPTAEVKKLVNGTWQNVGDPTQLPSINQLGFAVDTAGNPVVASDSYSGTVYSYDGSDYGKLDSIEVSGALIQVLQAAVDPATNNIYVMLTELVGINPVRSVMKYEGGNPSTGIASLNITHEYKVYPNPALNTITIEAGASGHVTVADLNGKVLLQHSFNEPITSIDVSALNSGVYLVTTATPKGFQVNKIIKH